MEKGKAKMEKAKSKMQKKKEIWGKRQNQEIDEQNKEIECKKRKKKHRWKKIEPTSLNVLVVYLGHIAVHRVKCNQFFGSKEFIHTLFHYLGFWPQKYHTK